MRSPSISHPFLSFRWRSLIRGIAILLPFLALSLQGQSRPPQGIAGTWREPGGGVINIQSCGGNLCAQLARLPSGAPSRDVNNPEASLRSRALCGLIIGKDFQLSDPEHASGGKLYDPKSGKTYSGTMALHGRELHLRGYVGLKMFGRSETWQRSTAVPTCGH